MKSLVSDIQVRAKRVRVNRGWVVLRLEDDREIRFPTSKSRRLRDGDPVAVRNVELTCNGTGLHWPELDEDLSVQGILEGRFGYEG
jgi:hypothetical protein